MSEQQPSSSDPVLSRRKFLAAGAAGAATLVGLGTASRAFGGMSPSLARMVAAGTVTLGSYETGAGIKALAAATKKVSANTGIAVKTNTVDHNTFQEQINSYLQGHPDDVFTWFAGY